MLAIQKRPRNLLAIGVALVFVVMLAGPEVRDRFMSNVIEQEELDTSAQSRIQLWADCVTVMKKLPLFGVGPDHFPLDFRGVRLASWQGGTFVVAAAGCRAGDLWSGIPVDVLRHSDVEGCGLWFEVVPARQRGRRPPRVWSLRLLLDLSYRRNSSQSKASRLRSMSLRWRLGRYDSRVWLAPQENMATRSQTVTVTTPLRGPPWRRFNIVQIRRLSRRGRPLQPPEIQSANDPQRESAQSEGIVAALAYLPSDTLCHRPPDASLCRSMARAPIIGPAWPAHGNTHESCCRPGLDNCRRTRCTCRSADCWRT